MVAEVSFGEPVERFLTRLAAIWTGLRRAALCFASRAPPSLSGPSHLVRVTSPLEPIAAVATTMPIRATIELRLHDVEQIFDSLDAYPFYERDLDPDAEEYIVGSLRELPDRRACSIVVHLEGAGEASDEQRVVESAIHGHFARRATLTSRELKMVVRHGAISLVIGLAFLSTLLFASQVVADRLGQGAFASVLREGLVIGGWVAMWRPLEVFLYDWWPIVGERRLYTLLGRMPVQLVHVPAPSMGATEAG